MSITKKVAIGIAGTVLLGTFLFGTRFFGYVGSGVDSLKQAANDAVPFEMKLKEAKKKVANLDDVMRKQMNLIAVTQTDIEGLDQEIAKREGSLDTQVAEMKHLNNLRQNADTEYVSVKTKTATKKYSKEELKNDLAFRADGYKRAEQALASKRKHREEKQKQLIEFKKQYDELVTLKENMELRIKELESKQAALETRKAAEAAQYDDSDVKEAQEILDELERGTTVESKMLDMKTGSGSGRIDVDLSGEGESESLDENLEEIFKKRDVKEAEHLISTES
jgi:chromosome segregation ATPase